MPKFSWLLLSLSLFATNSLAIEPELQQQGMFYFNVSFDAGQTRKTTHDFGFRLDHGQVKPGESMRLSELNTRSAMFDIKYNSNGLQSFKIHGVDYTQEYTVARGAEAGTDEATAGETAPAEATATEPEAQAEPVPQQTETVKKIDIPLGVIIGALIGGVALLAGAGGD